MPYPHDPPSLSHLPDELLCRIFSDSYVRTEDELARWERLPRNTTPLSKRLVRSQTEGLWRHVQLHSNEAFERFINLVLARPHLGELVRSIEYKTVAGIGSDDNCGLVHDERMRRWPRVSDEEVEAIQRVIRFLANLRSLSILGSDRASLKIRHLLAHLPLDQLPICCTDFALALSPGTLSRHPQFPSHLRRLDLAFLLSPKETLTLAATNWIAYWEGAEPLSNLESLSFTYPHVSLCKPLVARCPNLRSLQLHEVEPTADLESLSIGILSSPSSLEEFVVSTRCHRPTRRGNMSLVSCVPALTGLKTFVLKTGPGSTPSFHSEALFSQIRSSSVQSFTVNLPIDPAELVHTVIWPGWTPSLRKITLEPERTPRSTGIRCAAIQAMRKFWTLSPKKRWRARTKAKKRRDVILTDAQVLSLSFGSDENLPVLPERTQWTEFLTVRDTGRANRIQVESDIFEAIEALQAWEGDIKGHTKLWRRIR